MDDLYPEYNHNVELADSEAFEHVRTYQQKTMRMVGISLLKHFPLA
ncbi:hypothetical protein KNP414_04296 [Paenibacillus mucilaginosus KNP414]|uniref:Uncharacterized protein n=1 Tax=Paenibacillus mucilaginosus (strain KNP414) TaxID=1036673 RepID=F8FJH8_PAEMK|nr:hypothetical protein KNP414_04296 [Paenibacillus mucilaginosus KNP414]